MVDELTAKNGTRILPHGVRVMNVNFPVPYADAQGVEITRLGDAGLSLPKFDPSQGFPPLGVPPLPFPSCADVDQAGEFCFVSIGVDLVGGEEPVRNADSTALQDDRITITPMDGDQTAGFFGLFQTQFQLGGMAP